MAISTRDKSVQVCFEEDLQFKILRPHLEFYLDYSGKTLVPIELIDLMTNENHSNENDKVQDVAALVRMMGDGYNPLQPTVGTYTLWVECSTRYYVIREATRYFHAQKNVDGGTKVLHYEGQSGDPPSLYLHALCREGRIVELLDALETTAKNKQQIPPRAMILNRKYRTLVGSWVESLHVEAELGHELRFLRVTAPTLLGVVPLEIIRGKKVDRFEHNEHHHSLLGLAWLFGQGCGVWS